MAENKTQPTGADVDAFLAAVPDPQRRADAETLRTLMTAATGAPAALWGPSIVGFGSYRYVYDSGRSGTAPLVGFSPRKANLVVYIMSGFAGEEALLGRLGKHTVGKSCLYLKKLADVDQEVLRALVEASVAAMRAKYPAA